VKIEILGGGGIESLKYQAAYRQYGGEMA